MSDRRPSSTCLLAMHAASCVAMQPLDTIKVGLQTQGASKSHLGVWSCMRQVVVEQGARALWRGTVPSLGVAVISHQLWRKNGTLPDLGFFVQPQFQSESLDMAFTTAIAITPLQVLKCRLQHVQGRPGVLQCVEGIVWESGMRGFFRGLSARIAYNLVGTVGVAASLMAGMLLTWRNAKRQREPVRAETLRALSVATFAVGFGLSLPFDVLATRLQTMPPSGGRLRQSWSAEALAVLTQHGLRGFFAGGTASLLSSACGLAAGILAFKAFDTPSTSRTPVYSC
ncbi:hypothetical protein PINS_up013376 [Pythium insidiosum]|nr:hypothetical protein PINS_up013376 [Pythium insidiosum]